MWSVSSPRLQIPVLSRLCKVRERRYWPGRADYVALFTCPSAIRFRVWNKFDSVHLLIMNASEVKTPGIASQALVRHEGHTAREQSECGWRDRLISREDVAVAPAAWVHAVDIQGAKLHYHKRSTELYYVLDGHGTISL